jgi:hypothetical protein
MAVMRGGGRGDSAGARADKEGVMMVLRRRRRGMKEEMTACFEASKAFMMQKRDGC